MVLVLAKKKLRSLRNMVKYAKEFRNPHQTDKVIGFFDKLSSWLKLNSSIFQIFADTMLGISFAFIFLYFTSYVMSPEEGMKHSKATTGISDFISKYFLFWVEVEKLEQQVKYTMMFLGNFKPIPKFDRYLGEVLIQLLQFWKVIITLGAQYHSLIFTFIISPLGILGASFQFAFAHDLFALITSHIHSIYSFFAFAYKQALNILVTLFYMFRGKKFNMLKGKVDDADYRIEELLFGVLLMSVIIFLLPTLLIYYISMVYLMCFIISLQTWLITMTLITSKLPVYLLGWMLKNHKVLPKGIMIERCEVWL